MDRVLGAIVSRALRRGLRGEPLWLAVGVGFWLVRRGRRQSGRTIWSGRLNSGQRIAISILEAPRDGTTAPAEG